MKVILLERVSGLGNLGDVVNVKSGYARNFLLPTKRAADATKANIERFEARRAELEKQQAAKVADSEARANALNGKTFAIAARVGDEGRLFGSIGSQNIAAAIEAAGVKVARNEISLPHGTIREIGEFPIKLHFFGDVSAEIIVKVEAE